jgi:TRAP-type transport system periplasmic protein
MLTRREAALMLAALPLAACGGEHAAERATGLLYGRAVSNTPPRTPWDAQWTYFKEAIAEDRTIRLDYFNRAETGNEEQQLFDLRRGRAMVGGMSLQGLASVVPELSIPMAPYLFSSQPEVDFVYDTELLAIFRRLFEEKGLKLMQWVEVGWTNLYSNGPVLTPGDARGKKLRGSPNLAAQGFLSAIGADQIPLGTPEVVPALQTGLITGGLAGTVFHAFSTRAFASDFTLTQHSYDTGAVVANLAWWRSATDGQIDTLSHAWMPSDEARAGVRSLEAGLLADFASPKAPGTRKVAVHALTQEQRAQWVDATKGVSAKLIAQIGGASEEVYAAIERGKAAFAARRGA